MGWKITQADLAERFGAPFRFGTAGLLREFLGSLGSESPVVTVWFFKDATLQGINISYLGKRKIIFKSAFLWDMLVPRRVYIIHYIIHCYFRQDTYQSESWRYVSGLMQVPGSFFPGFAVARSLFDAALQITGACGLHHSRPGPSRGRCTKTRWDEVEEVFVHPGRLTWNLRIHPWKRKIIFQAIIFRFYVNRQGCKWTLIMQQWQRGWLFSLCLQSFCLLFVCHKRMHCRIVIWHI